MKDFEKELAFLLEYEESNDRYQLCEKELQSLKEKYPNVPNDYIAYLREIGVGTIREIQFRISDSPFNLKDLGLDGIYDLPATILFFGDNYSGDFAGFDLSISKDEVIEFWHDSNEIYHTNKSFREYIQEQMLMDENGSDLRT